MTELQSKVYRFLKEGKKDSVDVHIKFGTIESLDALCYLEENGYIKRDYFGISAYYKILK